MNAVVPPGRRRRPRELAAITQSRVIARATTRLSAASRISSQDRTRRKLNCNFQFRELHFTIHQTDHFMFVVVSSVVTRRAFVCVEKIQHRKACYSEQARSQRRRLGRYAGKTAFPGASMTGSISSTSSATMSALETKRQFSSTTMRYVSLN